MSDKLKYSRAAALAVAAELCAGLKVCTTRLIVAGSLRRRKLEVGDIEILYSPIMRQGEHSNDLFTAPPLESAVEPYLDQLLRFGKLAKRMSVMGTFTWGPYNKLAVHVESGIPVDFFCEPCDDNWARSVVFRTGPTAMNLRLIEAGAKQGIRVHAYGAGLTKMTTGDTLPCKSEREFFDIVGVPWLEPYER